MNSKKVILKPGKEKAVHQRHHWIFSGAVDSLPDFEPGDLLPVYAANGELLGSGYFNRSSGIIGRLVAFDPTPPLKSIEQRLKAAHALRQRLFDVQRTNAYRLINAEGDGVPGLIVDLYDQVAVLQSSTKGMDRLKPWVVDWLNQEMHPQLIYEKSLLPSRREEGIPQIQGILSGKEPDEILFKENGLLFTLALEKSQKTGFFLDHRETRQWIRELARGKVVLNAFSYTGGFSVYALAGGAKRVDSVDISEDALENAKKNLSLNGFSPHQQGIFCADVFTFLRESPLPYDLVILDPPAFAKKRKDIVPACRGYKDINRLAMQKMPPASLLLTCSCSHYVDEALFQKVLFQAALEAKRQIRMIGGHRLAPDHPINLFHPESQYLKSTLLFIE